MKIQRDRIKVLKEHRDLLPKLTNEEYDNLKADMEKHGQRTPLVLLKGTTFLLDGHNRFDIARALKWDQVEVVTEESDNALQWIIKNQLSRRNLSELDRDRLMAKLVKTGKKVEEVAKENKVSKSTVKRVVKQQEAIDKLPKEVQEEVKEAGTRREAVAAIAKHNPDAKLVLLRNRLYELMNGLENLEDFAEAVVTAGGKDYMPEMKKAIDFNKVKVICKSIYEAYDAAMKGR